MRLIIKGSVERNEASVLRGRLLATQDVSRSNGNRFHARRRRARLGVPGVEAFLSYDIPKDAFVLCTLPGWHDKSHVISIFPHLLCEI